MLINEGLKILIPEGEGDFMPPNLFRAIYLNAIYLIIGGCASLAAVLRFRNSKALLWFFVGSFSYFLVSLLPLVAGNGYRYDVGVTMIISVAVSIAVLGIVVFVRRSQK
jgi:hypothetical protein